MREKIREHLNKQICNLNITHSLAHSRVCKLTKHIISTMSNKTSVKKRFQQVLTTLTFFVATFAIILLQGAEMILAGFSRYIQYDLKKVLTMQFFTFNCKRIEFYWLACKSCSFWLAVTNCIMQKVK